MYTLLNLWSEYDVSVWPTVPICKNLYSIPNSRSSRYDYVSTHHIQLGAMIQVGGARSRQQGRVVGRQSLRRRVVIVTPARWRKFTALENISELLELRD